MLHYEFPEIYHIDQVLPHIADDKAFGVFKKDGYTVIDYNYISTDTFPDVQDEVDIRNKIRRECRGLIFNEEGKLISRRFHKFFNFGEREELLLANVDLSEPHYILEKLDGSMVSPVLIKDKLEWCTRMGITFISPQVEAWLVNNEHYKQFVKDSFDHGYTSIFEWCSRQNRVVIDHPVDRLVLTSLRHIETGRYESVEFMKNLADSYNIDVVKTFDYDSINIIDIVRQQEGVEGVVIRFNDGHMLKVKCDWYVSIHKAKSFITSERAVVQAIVDNTIDDVLPLLPKEDKDMVVSFRDKLITEINIRSGEYFGMLTETMRLFWTPKNYALSETAKHHNYLMKGLTFLAYNGKITLSEESIKSFIINNIKKNCNHTKDYLEIKKFIFPKLDYRYEYEEN